LKLLVNVCRVSLFTRPDGTDNGKALFFVDSIDHAVCREFVFPVKLKRGSQRKSVALGINCEFFRQHFLELISDASIQRLYLPEGVTRE